MTISGYSNTIVDAMLGWLKGLANWVLRLFNLAGAVSTSPLLWLSRNWVKLLVFFLALGIILVLLIWLVRWRPYWVWFRKERIIVNDDRFFANADMDKAGEHEKALRENWDEHDYVVASTVVKRQERPRLREAARNVPEKERRAEAPRRRRPSGTRVQRHVQRPHTGRSARSDEGVRPRRTNEKAVQSPDNIFAVDLQRPDVSDFYEDEVFNVSNLPPFDDHRQKDE